MPEMLWKRRQDPICKSQMEALNDKINSFEALVGNLSAENVTLKEELANRYKVLSDDLTSMEGRLMTRIEEVEGLANPLEPSSTDKGNVEITGGHTRWTDRKRQVRDAESDPSVFTKPYQLKTRKPAETAASKKE